MRRFLPLLFILISGVHFADLKAQPDFGSALDFDGIDDYVSVGNSAVLDFSAGDFTIEFWMNRRSGGIANARIVSKGAHTDGTPGYAVYGDDNTVTFTVSDGISVQPGVNGNIKPDIWQHIAAVRQGANLKIYVNGTLAGENTLGLASSLSASSSFIIGATDILVSFFPGKIEDLRVWTIARTQTEIQDNMLVSLSGTEANLVAYYRFDEAPADAVNTGLTTIFDATTNILDGTLINFGLSGIGSNWSNTFWKYVATYSKSDYYTLDINGTWEEANNMAQSAGGDLVAINSPEEQSFLESTTFDPYWIGLFQNLNSPDYVEPAGGWEWTTGEDFTYTNWGAVEPNDGGAEDFAHVGVGLQWNDVAASTTFPALLEFTSIVADYPFNANANDESGNGNDLSVLGPVLANDRFTNSNSAYSFDGDDYMSVFSSVIPSSGDFTVSAWAKYSGPTNVDANIVSQNVSSFLLGQKTTGNIRILDSWDDTGIPFPTDGNWHHYVLTKDDLNTILYLDNVLVASLGSPISNPSGPTPEFRVGVSTIDFGGEYFTGSIDDIKVYDYSLEAADINVLYMNGTWPAPPASPGLFSYTTSDVTIELSWDDVENETGYILERSTDDITYLQFTTLAADATGFTDSGLSPNTLYYYRIRSQNAQGESANSTARNATFSTSPSTRFENFQTFGGDGFDYGRAVAVDASGNYYFWGVFSTSINIGGTILTNSNGRQAMFLAKYDANDNFLWARSYLPSINGFAHEVSISNTGDIYLTGQFEGTFMSLAATPVDINGVNYSNGFLLKIDVNGNEIWTRTFSQSGNGNMYGLDTDSNGDVYVSGTYRASGLFAGFSLPSQGGAAIFKYDESGNEIWADYSVQTDESSLTTFLGLNVSINNEIYVSGRIFSTTTFGNTKGPSKAITASNGVEDALLIKYNTDGSVAWITNAGSDQFDNAFDVVTDDFGNVYLGGHFFGTNISFSNGVFNNSSVDGELFLARYDAGTGANIWGQAFGGIGEELLLNLATDGTNVFMTGTREPFPASFGSVSVENGRYYLINVDPDGNVSWVDVAEGHMRGRGMTYYNGTLYIPGRFEYRINVGGTYYDSNSNTSDAFLGKVTVGVAGNEIAFFPFTGGSTADVLGNGFVGTVVNATTTTDRFNDIGNAYNFDPNDGSRDAIVGNSTLGLSQTLTFAAWIKPSAFGNGQQYTIISERMNGAESWQFAIIDDFLYFSKWDPSFIESTSNSNSGLLSVNRWQHVAVTYDGSDARFYVNGQLDVTSGMSGDIRTNATVYQIGRWGTDDEYFDGDIDDIHVYDYALSDSDIQSLYNSESGLTEWFPLDNGDANEFYGKLVATPNGSPVSTTNRFGTLDAAMNFDGSGSFGYNGNTSIGGSSRFSISAWARPNYDGPIGTILSENSVVGQQNFYVDLGGNAVILVTYDNAQTSFGTASAPTIKPFEWNHVVVTFDNGEITTYVNNQLSSTGSHTSPVNDGTSPLAIGAATLFNGDIDDIRIFNYSLSPEQVSDLFFENGWTGVSTAGLLATYPFNGNANDESGNGFNGAPTGNSNGGPGLTSDRFGNPNSTYLFDGFDDHIRIDHGGGINLGGEVTFNAWIKPTVYPSGGDLWSIIFKDDVINEFQLDAEGNINYHWFDGIGFPSMETQPYKAPLGVWSMATVTIDVSDNLSIYIDGELYASQLITRFISSPFTSSIGGDYNQLPADGGDRRWFTGAIDDVRIYNRALSQTDIKALYNFGGWTGPSDLIAHYPVDAVNGGNDITGNGNNLDDELTGVGASGTDRFGNTGETFEFDGTGQYLVARNSTHPTGNIRISYSFWEYHTQDHIGKYIAVGTNTSTDFSAVSLFNSVYQYQNGMDVATFSAPTSLNRWNHVVLTRDGDNVTLYVNGVAYETITMISQGMTTTDIFIGQSGGGTEFFAGRMDDIRIYNYGLSETEVLSLFDERVDTSIPIVQLEPSLATPDDQVRLIYNAERGNKGLMGLEGENVHIHTGVITADPNGFQPWEFVIDPGFNDNSIGEMTRVAGTNNQWEITIGPSIRDFYGVPNDGTPIYKLNSIFRSASVSAVGNGIPEFGSFPGGYISDGGEPSAIPVAPGDIYMTIVNPTPLEFDSLALVALYQALNGDFWFDNSNWLTGSMDTWYGVTVSGGRVIDVFLDFNNLVGELPAAIGRLDACEYFSVTGNDISGSIPTEVGDMTSLLELSLDANSLSGSIPTEIGNLTNLTALYLNENFLTGTIPGEIGNLTNLQDLVLYTNQLSGSIPNSFQNLTGLQSIDLEDNDLSGLIPSYIGNFTSLTELWLSDNLFAGPIPPELGNLFNLDVLYLGYNELTGQIPAELGNLSNLTTLELPSNNLTGQIPNELGNLFNIVNLDLSDNNFTGAVPASFGSLSLLSNLDVSSNLLEDMVDLSGAFFLDELHVELNKFTMEDLLLNLGIPSGFYHYDPQELVGQPQTRFIADGTDYKFDLGFDANVTGSTYEWYQQGGFITSTSVPFLDFSLISTFNGGNWSVFITNSSLPGLELETENIFINVQNICISEATDAADSRIDRIRFGDIDNFSDLSQCATYTNFTQFSATIYPGQIVDVGVTLGTCAGDFDRMAVFYIDWNQDGSFDDATERIVWTTDPAATANFLTGTYDVPTDANFGTYLMRIVAREVSTIDDITGCGTYDFGETEDYTVNVVDGAPNLSIELVDATPNAMFNPLTPIQAGDQIAVTTLVGNSGLAEITDLVRGVGYYLSTDQFWDAGDVEIGTSSITSLPGGDIITLVDEAFTIPNNTAVGGYYLIVLADPDGVTTDPDLTDNVDVSSLPVNVSASPDSEPPTITLQNAPGAYTLGTGGVEITASITDNVGISTVGFAFAKITQVTDDFDAGQYTVVIPDEVSAGVFAHTFTD
ncbi:MAG: hypothetical protein IIB82_10700, partial [Bacteroidetes bacterium]|nr:hypothetical protein [Bacteroidota bacterium]